MSDSLIDNKPGRKPIVPKWAMESKASNYGSSRTKDNTNYSIQNNSLTLELDNVNAGVNPFESHGGEHGCSVKQAVILCQKAYWNVGIFRQTIDMMTEFANSSLYFEGSNKRAIKFFQKWDKKIKGWSHRDQFFREYFRSGNIFLYRIENALSFRGENDVSTVFVPVKYLLLNPADMRTKMATKNYLKQHFVKVLNTFEINMIKNSEPEVFDGISRESVERIKLNEDSIDGVEIDIDPEKLHCVFAKKQDYEPMSVPMFFPVLYDINLKLQFKKAENIIARATDHIILLMTVGDEHTDSEATQALINEINVLFKIESVGRVLVSDYTTKGEFLIPDFNKILGPEKYKVVNEDIANGLMNIFFKDEKFSNSSVKITVFIERLKEARKAYLENFLIPEMERMGKMLGFRSLPEPKFTEIDLKNEVEYLKLYNRLAELNVITPEETLEAYRTGVLPLNEDSIESQKSFKELRDKGMYLPLLNYKQAEAGRPVGAKAPKKSTPIGAKELDLYSLSKVKDVFTEATKACRKVEELYKEKYGLQRISKNHAKIAFRISEALLVNESPENWESKAQEYLNNINSINAAEIDDEVLEISSEHGISLLLGKILKLAKIKE